jgi:hypothetical protein
MIKEEGARALWRGFALHMLSVVIFLSALPTATDFLMQKMPVGPSDSMTNLLGASQQPASAPSHEEWYEQGGSNMGGAGDAITTQSPAGAK